MGTKEILIVDDEKDIQELLEYNLRKHGYSPRSVSSGEDALRESKARPPHLLILDIMLPRVDGLDVCRRLKRDTRLAEVPIIMLSARGEEADIVAGLELGADDYITKPFSVRVLLARVSSVLRRREGDGGGPKDQPIVRGLLRIDPARHEASLDGAVLALTPLEMRILSTLARAPGRVFTRYQIVEATQGVGVGVTDRSVDVHMVSLRRKLAGSADLIETIRGVGYRFGETEL